MEGKIMARDSLFQTLCAVRLRLCASVMVALLSCVSALRSFADLVLELQFRIRSPIPNALRGARGRDLTLPPDRGSVSRSTHHRVWVFQSDSGSVSQSSRCGSQSRGPAAVSRCAPQFRSS